ncbi:allantoinase AllB [Metabacillus halosaccharovorans]|uniref:allantoinase n=1 Tax=Metabacillus halosaccharovorans TaxID=930124 RepID=A0ABT3DLC8_9BACI|nr:allantoinase AllB [Metabacillus halosaccharovorans]MCV9887864.1 allantoinase AllB [Metabacillus halosaccharovorans]
MSFDLLIKNGIIVKSDELVKGNVYIKNEKIAAITSEELLGEIKETIDAEGKLVFPGFIDTHVHSRDPGATYKEDFRFSTQAAAVGGVTTIFEMPNTNPPINNVENFNKQTENLKSKAFVDYGIWAICLGHLNLSEYKKLHESGIIGFKFFWGYAVHSETFQLIYNYNPDDRDVIPPFTDGKVFEMFEEVAKTGQIFAIHAENNDLIHTLTKKIEKREGRSYQDLLEGRPNLAEELTIQSGIAMAKKTGARLHILHISTKEGVKLIREAQKQGYPITGETCPHYLFLSDEDYEKVGPLMKVYPPIKYKEDQDALWQGIKDGTISLVCSDHAPHTEEEKDGDLWSIPAGMCGVETLVPLMLNAANKGMISIHDVVRLLAEGPAKLFNIYPTKGAIKVGTDADLTIVDMEKEFTIKKKDLHSKSKITAFNGYKVKGAPVYTIIRGSIVMEKGEILGQPAGTLVTPNQPST